VDIAETKQDPFQYPGGYALADAAGEHHFDDKTPTDLKDDTQNADEPMEDQTSNSRSPEMAKSPDTASNDAGRPPWRLHPMPEYVDPEPAGIWTDPGPPSAVAASTSTSTAAAPNNENNDDQAAEGDEQSPEERREPNIVENQDEMQPQGPGTQAQALKTYHEALRMASAVSEERNRILDGLPPRRQDRQDDGQPAPKQPRLEEVHMVQMTTEDELFAVVESRLDAAGKQAFKEAKIKSLVPWCENDAWRPVNRTEAPAGTIVPMRFLLRYKDEAPHARMILQGFKHRDVLEAKLDTESPTLSRLGCILRWKIGTMDVKSAFLQADYIHHKVDLYGEPSADMRRLLKEMIGLLEHQVMQMTKPAFGDVRAPKQWNETADRAITKEVGFLKHALDGCLYLSTRLANKEDDPFRVFKLNGMDYVVDGILGLHVDDIIAAGEFFHKAEDAVEPQGDPQNFAERMHVLLHRFRFGAVNYDDNQTFCGAQMSQSLDYSQVNFSLEKYIKQLKPLTIEKNRKANPEEKATDREVSQLRGLLGGMAWPANQTQPHLSAAISLAQATVSGAKVADLNEANKILRFAKETADIPLTIRAHGALSQLRFGFFSDASWSTRPDGSSQGGWLLFLASEDQINGDRPFPLTVVDWASRKLPRICRSSLSAEAQIMTTAVDNLEWAKTMFGLILWPSEGADSEHVMKWLGISPCITDARALFDASTSATPGMKLAEKRTAIEIKITAERLQAACGMMRWCNSHQQLADGVTKSAAKTKLAMELRRGVHCLRYDPEYVASKKVKQEDKDKEQEFLDNAAKEIYKKHQIQENVFHTEDMDEIDKEEANICLLDGCSLPAEHGKRYCTKRHYHAAQHKRNNPKRAETALATWMVLTAAAAVPGADALRFTEEGVVIPYIQIIAIVVLILVAMIASFLAGINYVRHREHQGDPGLPRELQEHLIPDEENNLPPYEWDSSFMESSVTSVLNRSGEEPSFSTDGLGQPETHEGDIISPTNTPRLPNGERVESSNGGVVSWLTPGQVVYLKGEGYYVYSDAEVNQRRTALEESMPPSVDEVMTPELITALMQGTLAPEQHMQVPLDASDCNGVHPDERAERSRILENSLILGIEMEEMDNQRDAEARGLRARLRTVREVEASLRERNAAEASRT